MISGKTVEIKNNSTAKGITFHEFSEQAIAYAEHLQNKNIAEEIIQLFLLNVFGGNAKRKDKEFSVSGLIPYWKEASEDGTTMPECEFVLLPKGSKFTAVNGMADGEVLVSIGNHVISMYYSKIEWNSEGSLRSDVILIKTISNGVQQRCIESFSIAKPLPSSNGNTRTAADRRAQFEMMRKKLMSITDGVELEEEFR